MSCLVHLDVAASDELSACLFKSPSPLCLFRSYLYYPLLERSLFLAWCCFAALVCRCIDRLACPAACAGLSSLTLSLAAALSHLVVYVYGSWMIINWHCCCLSAVVLSLDEGARGFGALRPVRHRARIVFSGRDIRITPQLCYCCAAMAALLLSILSFCMPTLSVEVVYAYCIRGRWAPRVLSVCKFHGD